MKKNTTKLQIDQRLATLFDLNRKEVSAITDGFLHEIMRLLLDGNEVYLAGFGKFHVSIRRGKRRETLTKRHYSRPGSNLGPVTVDVRAKYYVSFRRAKAFKKKFDERFGKQKVVDNG